MKNRFLKLCAPGVATLHAYKPGKPLDELEREYGIHNAVKIASNENPLGPSPKVVSLLSQHLASISRYPDGNGFRLKAALADHLNVTEQKITLGNGSNEILELIARAFVTNQHEVIFSQHAFAVYPIVTQAIGAKAIVTPAKNKGYDLQKILHAITNKTRLIFIANPNNPTGTWLTKDELAWFLEELPNTILVVLDEAYFEFAIHPSMKILGYPDGLQWLAKHDNLIITRTFSKAYALAGLRVGYSVSHEHIADILNRVRQPFNVNEFALMAAETALDDTQHLQRTINSNTQGMQQITSAIRNFGLNYITSAGNFLSVQLGKKSASIYEKLLRLGVIVRPISNYELPDYLRFSIGTTEENQRVINALQTCLRDAADG